MAVVCTLTIVGEQPPERSASSGSVTPWDGQRGFWAAWNRLLYKVWGPAQSSSTSAGERSHEADAACPRCGEPISAHVIDRGGPGERTFMHCPRDVSTAG